LNWHGLLFPDNLWAAIASFVPLHPPLLKNGRPRLDDSAALTGIPLALRLGIS